MSDSFTPSAVASIVSSSESSTAADLVARATAAERPGQRTNTATANDNCYHFYEVRTTTLGRTSASGGWVLHVPHVVKKRQEDAPEHEGPEGRGEAWPKVTQQAK